MNIVDFKEAKKRNAEKKLKEFLNSINSSEEINLEKIFLTTSKKILDNILIHTNLNNVEYTVLKRIGKYRFLIREEILITNEEDEWGLIEVRQSEYEYNTLTSETDLERYLKVSIPDIQHLLEILKNII